MSALSITTIVIITTTVGGSLAIAGIIGAFVLARRSILRNNQLGYDRRRPDALMTQWYTNRTSRQTSPCRPLSFERTDRDSSQVLSRHHGLFRLLHGILPSRQPSNVPSDWAVANGGHVPRPHRLKKSKCTFARDSALLSGIGSSRPPMTRVDTDIEEDDLSLRKNRTVRAKVTKISKLAGKSHVVSMIVQPEFENKYHLRKSWLSSSDPHESSEAQGQRDSTETPTQRPKTCRSMSLPFAASSRPPSTTIPPIPVPSYSSQLFMPKRAKVLDASPSKRSFTSYTTVSSSIFNGLSPSLTRDLRKISAGVTPPESRRMMRRRSSAPSLHIGTFQLDEKHRTIDVLGRRPSGASSQLLPSPARPLMRHQSKGIKTLHMLQSNYQADISESTYSSERFKLQIRDTPISLIGLEADWDVFGYGNQMISFQHKAEEAERVMKQLNRARIEDSNRKGKVMKRLHAPRPRVLRKKWTEQESYTPLSFAAIPYSSTMSLDTPIQTPFVDNPASSVYSVPSALPQKSRNQVDQSCSASLRPITVPFPSSNQSSVNILDTHGKGGLRSLSPSPRHVLFGPRPISPIVLRLSSPGRTDALRNGSRRSESRLSCYQVAADSEESVFQATNEPILQNRRYLFEEIDSDEETEIHHSEAQVDGTDCHATQSKTTVDPPPVRLQPTPLRKSFYGYEAVPNIVHQPCSVDATGTRSIALPRPLSVRSTAAPRPPSSLSNNFRASVVSQPVSRQNSAAAKNRLSSRGSALLTGSQETSRPTSMSLIREVDQRRTSQASSTLGNGQQASTSPTPLKNCAELCNLFPKPLSMTSGSRPPTWIFSEKSATASELAQSGTSKTCPSSPRPARLGLPPHPRFYIDQQRRRSDANGTLCENNKPGSFNTIECSPSLIDQARMLTTSTQTTPSLTSHLSQQVSTSATAPGLAIQSNKTSTTNTPNHRDSIMPNKSILRSNILEPISVNIGPPTPFTTNPSYIDSALGRYREMSPSPSSQGSTTRASSPHFRKFNNKAPSNRPRARHINKPITTTTTTAFPPRFSATTNTQLTQRIKQAQQRKLQAQAQIQPQPQAEAKTQPAATTTILQGLGITIPSSSSLSFPFLQQQQSTVSAGAEAAPVSSKHKADIPVPSALSLRKVQSSSRDYHQQSEYTKENVIPALAAFDCRGIDLPPWKYVEYQGEEQEGRRMGVSSPSPSSSPGRILREECF